MQNMKLFPSYITFYPQSIINTGPGTNQTGMLVEISVIWSLSERNATRTTSSSWSIGCSNYWLFFISLKLCCQFFLLQTTRVLALKGGARHFDWGHQSLKVEDDGLKEGVGVTTVWINIIVGSIKQPKFFLVWTQWSIEQLMIRVIRMFQMNLHIQRKQSVWLSREDPN